MRLALVTTPPSAVSGIGDYVRKLLPHLRARCEVRAYVEPGREGEDLLGEKTLSAADLDPREHDQILYQLGNEIRHAFMARLVRALGGTVALHDWVLFDLALAAFPALGRGGWKGHALALREGGVEQARAYLRNWSERRRARETAFRSPGPDHVAALDGALLTGWHAPEAGGRWIADAALLRLPAGATRARILLAGEPGRAVELVGMCRTQARARFTPAQREVEIEAELDGLPRLLEIRVSGVAVSGEQRRRGDSRRLACFVRQVEHQGAAGWSKLDLEGPAALPIESIDLTRDRFRLPFNRSIVRFGDAFVVHSDFLRAKVLADRNAPTPIGVLTHGADPLWERWGGEDRRVERERLGLTREWRDAFLLTSFGGIQRHKRIEVVLAALAQVRRARPDAHLVLAGGAGGGEVDPGALARRWGVGGAVRLTGHLPEEQAWRWIHAGDLAVQLRGPSSGGSSGGIFQTLSLGRGVIASALDEQLELPDECVYKIAPGEGEAARLAARIVELRDAPSVRQAMEQAARDFVLASCRWELVAQRYIELLESFPAPRSARRSLIAMRFDRAFRAGWARGAK